MNIMVGDNRLENVAVRLSDVKVREAHVAENQQAQEILDEQAKKVASDGVVLELNQSGQSISNAKQAEALEKVQDNTREQAEEKAYYFALENEERTVADTQRVLENINI